jgi:hypothetical protein
VRCSLILLVTGVWAGVLMVLPAQDRDSVDENVQFREWVT